MDPELVNRCAMPAVALALGGCLLLMERTKTAGRLLCFLGAQTGMTLYMKQVLSNQAISDGRRGFPAAFAVTVLQQLTSFVLMMGWIILSRLTPYRYTPKQLSSRSDLIAVFLFSLAFTANIALNNYSVSLMPISVNLIIRSCFPLPTFLAQKLLSWYTRDTRAKDSSPLELSLMLLGCLCACVAVVARTEAAGAAAGESQNLLWGVTVCVISCFAGSANLVLAGMMGSTQKLDEFDTVVYTALPAVLLLLVPMSIPHTVHWDGGTRMTDWEILSEVMESAPGVVHLAALSGVFALAFNLLKYGIVQRLSATHTAFAGNFNKAFTIMLAMMQGLEPPPADGWGWLMVVACLGNICAFTGYNLAKLNAKPVQDPVVSRDSEKEPLHSESTHDDLEEKRSSSEDEEWEGVTLVAIDKARTLTGLSTASSTPLVAAGSISR